MNQYKPVSADELRQMLELRRRGGPSTELRSSSVVAIAQCGAEISSTQNIELRRVLQKRYGLERYMRDVGANKVAEDHSGILWRVEQLDDEPLVMVEVINSTPEPDGSFKHYTLRVPPTMRTAKEAVAWSFDMNETDYSPISET